MKKFFLALLVFGALLGGWFVFHGGFVEQAPTAVEYVKDLAERVEGVVEEAATSVSAPTPLRIPRTQPKPAVILTRFGVFQATNDARVEFGQSLLIGNGALDHAAELKLQDLFAKQYFDHVSPEGYGPGHWVEAAGYAYKRVGENLALGGFDSDADLVEAWMESPGHRENILNNQFVEIGIAVGKGLFEGEETWLAVQVFGRPLPACDSPSSASKESIDALQTDLQARRIHLDALRSEIERKQSAGEPHEEEVDEYNRLVGEYNGLAQEQKNAVEAYNNEVRVYNACMEK